MLEDRSCSSLESMVGGGGGAGRLAGGRRGVGQRPTSIDRSQSNEERTHILNKSEHHCTHMAVVCVSMWHWVLVP